MAYLFMNLGAFAMIQMLTEKEESEDVRFFYGLIRKVSNSCGCDEHYAFIIRWDSRNSWLYRKAKYYYRCLAVEQPYYVLVSVMIGTTVISYVYYFRIMVGCFSALH